MPIYNGSQKLKDIYIGGTKIKEIYNGSTLVYTGSQYDVDEVVFESSTAGTYSLELLETGKYEFYCVGGGGGYYSTLSGTRPISAGGGSGAGFIGIINITKGSISLTVGAGGVGHSKDGTSTAGGTSSIGSLVSCGGGGPGRLSGGGGVGGTITLNVTPVSSTLNSSGNRGNATSSGYNATGGASVYNGYGAGGGYNHYYGYEGYVKVVYKGR